MRLFVGVDLPGEVKDSLAVLIEGLRVRAPGAKWVPRDNLHLTLAFLGEVSEERLPPIRDALREAASQIPGPIETSLSDAGAFPSPRRARVLWIGLHDPHGVLGALAERVGSVLEPLGFERERRAWTPHLTLARFRVPSDATGLLGDPLEPSFFTVPDATLFRSRLARPAPTYEPLERFPIGG